MLMNRKLTKGSLPAKDSFNEFSLNEISCDFPLTFPSVNSLIDFCSAQFPVSFYRLCLVIEIPFSSLFFHPKKQCGADYVKVQQRAPIGMPEVEANARCVSVDGDADRVVYFFTDENNCFHLLDGDRIATLVADYLMGLVRVCNINLRMGLVQTAYANGASTDYIEHQLRVPVACVPTGVKHLHHKAMEFDIGVYFEANGHGTVIFSKNAKQLIKKTAEDDK